MLYFWNARISSEDLSRRICESINGTEPRAYVAVDCRAEYGDVKKVLDKVRDGGVERMVFVVEKQEH
jgi:biopolymer transport protein ExbD